MKAMPCGGASTRPIQSSPRALVEAAPVERCDDKNVHMMRVSHLSR